MYMHRHGPWKAVKIVAMVIVAAAVFGEVVMHLWNWLMPCLFSLHTITFTQALGLIVLSKLLFGGFHRHGGGGRGWKRHMEERWARMTPEEQEKFRSGMRGRHRCGPFGRGPFDPGGDAPTEQAPVA